MPETIESIVKRYTPTGIQLLCEPIRSGEKTAGGIIIPEVARNPLNQGKIIAVGTDLDEDYWKIGSIVMWSQHSESKLRIDNIELVVVPSDNIVLKSR